MDFDSWHDSIKKLLSELYKNSEKTFYYIENSNSSADWDEFMCMLYDDWHFDNFIDEYEKRFHGNLQIVNKLKKLNSELNAINIKATSDLLSDKHWHECQKISKSLIEEDIF